MNNVGFAKVAEVTASGVKLFTGDLAPASEKSYRYLASYSPVVGDRVAYIKNSGTLLVLGKVV